MYDQLFNEPGAVSIIVSLLENYLEKDLEMSYRTQNPEYNVNNSSMESGSDGSIEDVIIKVGNYYEVTFTFIPTVNHYYLLNRGIFIYTCINLLLNRKR